MDEVRWVVRPVCAHCATIRFIRARGCAVVGRGEASQPCIFCDVATFGRAQVAIALVEQARDAGNT